MSDRLVVLRQGVMVREFDSLDYVQEHDIVQYMT
jgi:ABC-type sugar transport system ATPase subunit